jgi:hypothetical protein
MAKDVNKIEGTLGNVDSMIGKLSESVEEDQGFRDYPRHETDGGQRGRADQRSMR